MRVADWLTAGGRGSEGDSIFLAGNEPSFFLLALAAKQKPTWRRRIAAEASIAGSLKTAVVTQKRRRLVAGGVFVAL